MRARFRHTLTLWLIARLFRDFPRKELTEQRSQVGGGLRRNLLPQGVRVTPWETATLSGEYLTPDAATPGVILYLHGGAYTMGTARAQRLLTAHLAQRSGMRVLAIDYRLAPEHPFPAALEDAQSAYRWLRAQGEAPLFVAGDSAGGGLALATLLTLRDAGEALPAGGVLFSPWVDLTLSHASIHANAALDPVLSPDFLEINAQRYAEGTDRAHPLISPLFADLHGLPPLLIHVGTHEILLDEARQLVVKARQAGSPVKIHVWEGMFHVFSMFSFLPESKAALAESASFLARK